MIEQIIISKKVQETWFEEINKFPKIETGGVVCGFYENNKIIFDTASGPGENAIQSETEFMMDKEHMHRFLDEEYERSAGMNIYVGEWHTHPQVKPKPSDVDIQSMYERTVEWQHGEVAFIIIGFEDFTKENLNQQMISISVDIDNQMLVSVPTKLE